MRLTSLLLLACAAAVIGGCGGASHRATPAAVAATPTGPPLTRADAARELGNGFRAGLEHLAVMGQQSDDASALAQDLPAPTLRDVRCRDAAGRQRWTCTVSWRTVDGAPQSTRYAVRTLRARCYVARATPQRPTRYDATIRTFSEDPLNLLGSARHGC